MTVSHGENKKLGQQSEEIRWRHSLSLKSTVKNLRQFIPLKRILKDRLITGFLL